MLLLYICFYQWDFFPSLIFIFLVVVFSLWSSLFNIFCKAGWKWKKVKEKKVKVAQSCPTLCDPMDYTVHGILRARILEWVSLSLLQGIFPTQGSNPGPPRCRQILYQLIHKGSPHHLTLCINFARLKKNQFTKVCDAIFKVN